MMGQYAAAEKGILFHTRLGQLAIRKYRRAQKGHRQRESQANEGIPANGIHLLGSLANRNLSPSVCLFLKAHAKACAIG